MRTTLFTRATALASAVAALAACQDHPVAAPESAAALSAMAGAAGARCAASPTVTVADERGLRTALDTARAGDVIAVSGLILLSDFVEVRAAGVTLTCAGEGAALTRAVRDSAGAPLDYLLWVSASDVTVQGLALEGAGLSQTPFIAFAPAQGALRNVRLLDSGVSCGAQNCAFFIGVAGARVAGNRITSGGTGAGVQMQGTGALTGGVFEHRIDGSVVSRNVIVSNAPSGLPSLGGVRVRDGARVEVTENEITGPWRNAVAVSELDAATVDRNRISGSSFFGILVGSNPFTFPSVRGSSFSANRVSDVFSSAVNVRWACSNTFQGNELRHNPRRAFTFEATTGANVFRGTGELVADNGRQDCDGDGVFDPNLITGGSVSTTPDATRSLSADAAEQAPASDGRAPAML